METETEMNIGIAIKHLSWRLKQKKVIPNEKDAEAFNCIIDTINKGYEQAVMDDKLFAKLLIERLLWLTMTKEHSLKNAIEMVKDSLSTSVHSWAEYFVSMVPKLRLSTVFDREFIKLKSTGDRTTNAITIAEAKRKVAQENEKELLKAFTEPYTMQEFEKFIKKLIFDLKKEYQNKP